MTSSRTFTRSMKGRKSWRLRPSLYRSSGCRFEVVITVTPASNSPANSRDMIAASAMLLTTISSKHSKRASAANAATTGGIGSPFSFSRSTFSRAWISSMNSWKCARRLLSNRTLSKNRSISIDLPRPTPPHRYSPRTGSGFLPSSRFNGLMLVGTFSSCCWISASLAAACAWSGSGFSSPAATSAS